MKPQDYASALHQAVHEVRPEDHDKVLENFVRVLNQNGDLRLYDQIEEEYKKLEGKTNGIKQVSITSAHRIDSKSLIKELNQIVGDKVEIKEKIDQSLIGGIVVRVDDTLIDASVKNELAHLKKVITKN